MTEPELPLPELKRFIDEFAQLGGLAVNISGGEPTMCGDFIDLWSYAARSGLKLGMETNGSYLTDEVIAILDEYPPISMRVSIYGASDENYKEIAGVRGGFKRVSKGIERLINAGIKPALRTPLTKQTISIVDEVKRFADSRGLTYVVDPKLWPGQDGRRLDHLRASASDVLEGGSSELRSELAEQIQRLDMERPVAKACGFGISEVYLGADGYINYCHTLWGHKFDWRNSTLEKAWNEWFPRYRDRVSGTCAGWFVISSSKGKCPWGEIYADCTLNPTELDIQSLEL